MKKILSFVAAALVAFSFASCNPNSPEAKGFKITVNDITATTAAITVEPTDTTVSYYWGVAEAAELAKISDDSLQANVIDMINYYIELYAMFGYDYTFEDFLSKGKDAYTYKDLTATTEYTVYAFKLNAQGVAQGGVAKQNFKTPEMTASETKALDFHDAVIDDYRDYDGSFQIIAAPADSMLVVYLNPISNTLAGHFTAADLIADYSGVDDYEAYESYDIAEADFTGVETANGATYEGWIICSNAVKYTFTFNAVLNVEGAAAPAKKAQARKGVKEFNKHFVNFVK